MIVPDGYSKDPNLIPEGIVVTWSKEVMQSHGGIRPFISEFKRVLADDEGIWMHNCKNKPTQDQSLEYVYIIVAGRLRYRCFYGGYDPVYGAVLMGGPIEDAPGKINLSGFRGFRYCTKLF